MVYIVLSLLGVYWIIKLEKHSRKLLKLKKHGVRTRCEIVSVEETKLKNSVSYTHTVRFLHKGEEVVVTDCNGYADRYPESSSPEIVYDQGNPQNFAFSAKLKKLITISYLFEAAVAGVTIACVVVAIIGVE